MEANRVAADSLNPSFLTHDPTLPHNVWLDQRDLMKGFGGWSLYTSGFKMAADELVVHLGEESTAPHVSNFVVYPIAFLYRQYLELRLKKILWSTSTPIIPKNHGLMTLWETVRDRLKDHGLPQNEPFLRDYERITALLRPLHELDPRSEAFRYPYDEKGELTISDDIKWINLQKLKEYVAEIAALLDGLWL